MLLNINIISLPNYKSHPFNEMAFIKIYCHKLVTVFYRRFSWWCYCWFLYNTQFFFN